jgi:hypothetical protein
MCFILISKWTLRFFQALLCKKEEQNNNVKKNSIGYAKKNISFVFSLNESKKRFFLSQKNQTLTLLITNEYIPELESISGRLLFS